MGPVAFSCRYNQMLNSKIGTSALRKEYRFLVDLLRGSVGVIRYTVDGRLPLA